MPENFSQLSEEKRVSLKEVNDKWNSPTYGEDITVPYDWASKVIAKMKEGDVNGMKAAALPSVQFEVIRLAHEGKNEQTRLQASTLILGQMGHGPVQKVEHSMNYEQMPTDQLTAAIASRLTRVIKLVPNLNIAQIVSAAQGQAATTAPSITDQEIMEGDFELTE